MRRLGVLAAARPANGGTFQYTLSTLQTLRRLPGWTVTVYSEETNDHYDKEGFPIRRLKESQIASVIADLLSLRTADPFVDEDVVIAPIYSPTLLLTRKPFVYTLHDLQERHYPEHFSLAQRLWRRYVHARLTRRASRVICESKFVKDDIARFHGVEPDRIGVVVAPPLLAADQGDASQRSDAVRAKYRLPQQYLFYPAQFWPHKNHRRLIEAFAKLAAEFPRCDLVLTGSKRGEYESVMRHAAELGVAARVRHVGYVEQDDLPVLYRLAAGLVMPTLFESVSIPVYEAFQAGIPVCASAVVALPEQIGDAGLLFDPLSANAIADAMATLLREPALCARLVENGQRRLAELTYDRAAAQLEALLAVPRSLPNAANAFRAKMF